MLGRTVTVPLRDLCTTIAHVPVIRERRCVDKPTTHDLKQLCYI